MYDVVIIGAGPAGISASLYAKRANKKVLVLYYGESSLEKAHKIDNYYGFEEGITGKELFNDGINQAKNLGVEIKNEEVLNIEKNDNVFNIICKNNNYESKTLIIATGSKVVNPNIEGIKEFEGKGISYCAICDGFFYRNKNVAVIGNGEYAISEANDLKDIVNKITILTNGEELEVDCDYEVIGTKINRILGDKKVETIEFEDGSKLQIDGIFIAIGKAGGLDFAKKIGVIVENNNIVVDKNMHTNIEGLFVCGNLTGGLLQVCKAVYEGAVAGLEASNYRIREE